MHGARDRARPPAARPGLEADRAPARPHAGASARRPSGRSEFPVECRSRCDARHRARRERLRPADDRGVEGHCSDPPGERRGLLRSRVSARRRRRSRTQRAAARDGDPGHDLGHAGLGERRSAAEPSTA